MTRGAGPPGAGGDPLAGVLRRLLARERGAAAAPVGAGEVRATPVAAVVPPARRMIAIAGLGADDGAGALRAAAEWSILLGRRPSVADLFGAGRGERAVFEPGAEHAALYPGIPRARVPCEPERLRRERGEVVAAVLERLRRHEYASDLVLVRIPTRHARTLMRGALLAGAVVVPVDESEAGGSGALDVSRDVLENLPDVRLWPFAASPRALGRYLETVGAIGEARPVPFDPGRLDLAPILEGLRDAPDEGFIAALLAPAPASLPADLVRFDSLPL